MARKLARQNGVRKDNHPTHSQRRRSFEKRQSDVQDQETTDVFPDWLTVWHVTFLTLAVRLWIVADRKQWWILHPDEVFQSVEGESRNSGGWWET